MEYCGQVSCEDYVIDVKFIEGEPGGGWYVDGLEDGESVDEIMDIITTYEPVLLPDDGWTSITVTRYNYDEPDYLFAVPITLALYAAHYNEGDDCYVTLDEPTYGWLTEHGGIKDGNTRFNIMNPLRLHYVNTYPLRGWDHCRRR